MNNVELKGITLMALSLSVALLGGCAGTTEQVQPKVQVAVARGSNTYVIKRASIRTPNSDGFQRAYADAVRPPSYQPLASSPSGLTREQYQTRFEAEQRLQKEQAERARIWRLDAEKQQLMAKKDAQRKALEAKRELYQAKWAQERKQKEAVQATLRAKFSAEQARKKLVQNRPVPVRPIIKQASAPTPAPTPIVRSNAAPILLGSAVRTSVSVRQPARVIRASASTAKLMDKKVESVIANAKKHLGTKYVWGGDSPDTGFDCSGLVQHSLRLGAQVDIPRTAADQYRASVKVATAQAARGDLVFFRTRGSGVSHVGIYLGEGRFLHAPRTGKTVTTTALSGYWKERLIGFGRIPGACAIPLPA